MKQIKRLLAVLLVFALLFSTFPIEELAATIASQSTVNNQQKTSDYIDTTQSFDETETVVIENILSFEPIENDNIAAVRSEVETTITGTVKDNSGNGISQVVVTIYDITNNEYMYAYHTTVASGNWEIKDAWIGDKYLISYYKAGYEFDKNNIEITAKSDGNTVETVTATLIQGLVCKEADYTYTTDTTQKTATITGYTGKDSGIILPNTLGGYPVIAIAANAFKGNTILERVAISDNVKEIYDSAFADCTNLTNVYLPNILTHIYSYAFQGCTGIESIEIPDSVELIGYRSFCDCTKLSSVKLPLSWNSATSGYRYGEIFSGCSSLTRIEVPEGITDLPNYAFKDCTYLRTVVLPNSLKSIGSYAFAGCEHLRISDIPDTVVSIGKNAYSDCSALQYAIISNHNCKIGDNAFDNSNKVMLCCVSNSFAQTHAIEYDVQYSVVEMNDSYTDGVLDRSATYYFADTNSLDINGYVTLTVNYVVSDNVWNDISDSKIVVKIPKGTNLIESTLRLDNTICTIYDYDEDKSIISYSIFLSFKTICCGLSIF